MGKYFITACFILFLASSASFALGELDLPVHAPAPDFSLYNHDGRTVSLSDMYKDGPVALIFYRGGWCPYCNLHLQSFERMKPEFDQRGIQLAAVSVDRVEMAMDTAVTKNISFPLLSNPEADVLEKYGLIHQIPQELVTRYKEEYEIDLEDASGQTHHIIAYPAVFLIDGEGTIVYSYGHEDYKIRVPPEDVIAKVEEHGLVSEPEPETSEEATDEAVGEEEDQGPAGNSEPEQGDDPEEPTSREESSKVPDKQTGFFRNFIETGEADRGHGWVTRPGSETRLLYLSVGERSAGDQGAL